MAYQRLVLQGAGRVAPPAPLCNSSLEAITFAYGAQQIATWAYLLPFLASSCKTIVHGPVHCWKARQLNPARAHHMDTPTCRHCLNILIGTVMITPAVHYESHSGQLFPVGIASNYGWAFSKFKRMPSVITWCAVCQCFCDLLKWPSGCGQRHSSGGECACC